MHPTSNPFLSFVHTFRVPYHLAYILACHPTRTARLNKIALPIMQANREPERVIPGSLGLHPTASQDSSRATDSPSCAYKRGPFHAHTDCPAISESPLSTTRRYASG